MAKDGNTLTATPSAGNTKQPKPKARHWQLTLNDIERWDELKDYLESLKSLNYIIACQEEAPTTGHKHIHCYCQFTNALTLSLKSTQGAHIEACRGTPQQNVNYIMKDGNVIYQKGTIRKSGATTIADVKQMTKTEREDLPIQYANIVRRMNEDEADSLEIDDIHKDIRVIYIWGPSGVGKTKKALEICKEKYTKTHMIKYENGFYAGVGSGTGCAIYDDFRDSHMKASEFINLIDYNIHTMNVKGGFKQNRYELLIITSVQNPERLYKNMEQEPRKQWMRRLEIIHLEDDKEEEDSDESFDIVDLL